MTIQKISIQYFVLGNKYYENYYQLRLKIKGMLQIFLILILKN